MRAKPKPKGQVVSARVFSEQAHAMNNAAMHQHTGRTVKVIPRIVKADGMEIMVWAVVARLKPGMGLGNVLVEMEHAKR